jgi:hypothetical protein
MLPDLVFCYFYRGHNTMYFELKFCTIVVYEVVYNQVFLFNFFETLKFEFFCGSKNGLH